jgi:hypothetical protein
MKERAIRPVDNPHFTPLVEVGVCYFLMESIDNYFSHLDFWTSSTSAQITTPPSSQIHEQWLPRFR